MGRNLRWVVAGGVTVLAFAVPVWLCGAVVLPSLLKDPAIRWPLASALGAALAALAAVWGQGFATGGRGTTGQPPSAPTAWATGERAVAIGGNNQGAVSTGNAPVPAQPTPAGPAAPPASPPQTTSTSASGERSIAIGGDNSGPLSTGDQPGGTHP